MGERGRGPIPGFGPPTQPDDGLTDGMANPKGVTPPHLRKYLFKSGKRTTMAAAKPAGAPKRRRTGRRKRRSTSGRPKRASLTKILVLGGVAALTTSLGADAADALIAGVQPLARAAGYTGRVTGATLLSAALAAKAACAFSPWFRAKWTGFLGGFGLRP